MGGLRGLPGAGRGVLTTPATPRATGGRQAGYGGSLVRAGLGSRDAAVAVDFAADLVLSSSVAMRGPDRTVPDAAAIPT